MSTNTDIAKEILRQLGGNKLKVMTGARQFVAIENGLMFKLPARMAKDGINHVRILLNAGDTYSIEFGRVWGANFKEVDAMDGVYCDAMLDVIGQRTGLVMRMPRIIF